ncbi:MAG: hypothetical protein DDT40_00306 [candidate division WS2 bacterium]|nr:MAG: nucleotidyltransferase domain-containing protein [Methanosarcinales archaeon Met12]MBT9150140.1 hypothetical protein [Candidatus Psychracetigena formicireducens]
MRAKVLEKEEVLQKIGEVLSGFEEIDIGYVFGSFLKGEFEDIDVALLVSKSPSPYESMKFAMKVGREVERTLKYSFEIDVKILNSSPTYFQYEVIKNGKVVFCKDETKRIRYEAKVLSNYLDYKDTLDWIDKKLLARV